MKRSVICFLIGVLAAAAVGSEMKPLLDHIAAPRRAMDLDGIWKMAEVRNQAVPETDAKGKKTVKYETVPLDPSKAKWKSVTVPYRTGWFGGEKDFYFRRDFQLAPDQVKRKRITLHFELIMENFTVWINGRKFQGRPDSGTHSVLDISSAVQSGRNEILVRVFNDFQNRRWADSMPLVSWAVVDLMGLNAPVHLEITDPLYVNQVKIRTDVTPEKVFHAEVLLKNGSDVSRTISLAASVAGEWKRDVPQVEIPAHGEKWIRISRKWPHAKLWSPDIPQLYHLDLRVLENGKAIDAYRQRFGFREFRIAGHRILLNGYPVIHRRLTWNPKSRDPEGIKKEIEVLKKHGVTTIRIFYPNLVERLAFFADETGLMLCPTTAVGGGAGGKSDAFWKLYHDHIRAIVRELQPHPSVAYWGVSNEFGTIYGTEGSPGEQATTGKQVKAAGVFESCDPTRFWTAHGEIDLGYPVRSKVGPAPVRSFHYPVPPNSSGKELPEIAYWYPDGKNAAWQRFNRKDKPLMISEDLFHGVTDQHLGMAKFAGDTTFSLDGYIKALRWAVRTFAAGYYLGGLSEWEPWCMYPDFPDNPLYRDFQLMPDYLIAIRGFFPNLHAGETDTRMLYVHNVRFTPQHCRLVKTIHLDGRRIGREEVKFLLNPGIPYQSPLKLSPPAVRKPAVYTIRFELFGNENRKLAEETFDYQVYPRKTRLSVPAETALLADGKSPLHGSSFPKGSHREVAKAIASGARQIVVDKILSFQEGIVLNDFVRKGGKVLAIDIRDQSWAPADFERRKPMTFLWKRNPDAFRGIDERSMRSWKPDGFLGDAYIPKNGDEDSFVLWDSGHMNGLVGANILWIVRGRGAWLLCQLPVTERFSSEPVAPYLLEALFAELEKPTPNLRLTRKVQLEKGSPSAEFFRKSEILFTEQETPGSVWYADCSGGLNEAMFRKMKSHCASGGIVIASELPRDTDPKILESLGLRLEDPFQPVPGKERDPHIGGWPEFVLSDSSGIFAGISTDDLFRANNGKMWNYFRYQMIGEFPPRDKRHPELSAIHAKIVALPGSKAKLHTLPASFAEIPIGKGRLLLSTLKIQQFRSKFERKTKYFLRTLFNNLGAATAKPRSFHEYMQVDLSRSVNRNLWNNPKYQKKDGSFDPVGWFGTGNDMRYFPVNLCGWSMEANNYCPVQPFPQDPVNYGGILFRLIDPEKNAGKAVLVIQPGETVTLPMPGRKIHRLYFLGADNGFQTNVTIAFNANPEKTEMKHGVHYGIYRWTDHVTLGKIGWTGYSMIDSSTSLYVWGIRNPEPESALKSITLQNLSSKESLAILAVTAELK